MHQDTIFFLIQYMVEIYDSKRKRFVVQDKVGEISATAVDVECIYGLVNSGFNVADILEEEGSGVNLIIPPHFKSTKTGNIVIQDLINDIIESGSCDDDFVRKTGLVLLGIVIAPHAVKVVPKVYYVLVQDLDRLKELNLNEFTLLRLMENVTRVRSGKVMIQWPLGNLSLLQVNIKFLIHASIIVRI